MALTAFFSPMSSSTLLQSSATIGTSDGGGAAATLQSTVGLRSANQLLQSSRRSHACHPRTYKKQVACSLQNDDNIIDRRELMLGTAASLSIFAPALASASPVTTPNLSSCKLAEIAQPPGVPGPTSQVLCCLLKTTKPAVLYKLPPPPRQLHVRKAAHLVDEAYITKYNRAYSLMKALPADDPRNFMRQADIHCAYCNNAYNQPGTDAKLQIHFSSLFFPWHRWYLYFHERILASLIGDPSFTLPFWAWDDQQTGGNVIPPMFNRQNTAIYDSKRNLNHLPPVLNTLNFNPEVNPPNEQIILENLSEMYQSVVTATTPSLFLGGIFRAGDTAENPGIGGTLENGPHTAIHAWMGDDRQTYGEDMGNFYSAARDPIFYAHHSNVDRMWDVWKSLGGRRRDITDPDFLNAEFYFYDEKAQLVKVKVRDGLSSARLGFTYQKMPSDQLWINFVPKALAKAAKAAKVVPVDPSVVAEIGVAKAGKESRAIGKQFASSAKRIPKGRRKKEEEELEEILVLEGVEVPRNVVTQLLVFINLPDADGNTPTSIPEYAGSFYSIPHVGMSGKSNVRTTNVRLAISDNIDRLGITDLSNIVVTVVARGVEVEDVPISIKGIRIEFE